MQFVSAEQHSIGDILPHWHKKLMHYSQPNARLNLHLLSDENRETLRMHWNHKAWPSLLSQTPHLCHKGLRGQAFVKAKKTCSKSFEVTVITRARSNFLSSYWSASEQETPWLNNQGYGLISTFDIAGKHKVKPQKVKHNSRPSFPQQCVDVSHSSTLVVTQSIVCRVSLWKKWTDGLAHFLHISNLWVQLDLTNLDKYRAWVRSSKGRVNLLLERWSWWTCCHCCKIRSRGARSSLEQTADPRGSFPHQLTSQ